MTTISRYDPFREALSLSNVMDEFFERSIVRSGWDSNGTRGVSVPMDVFETEQGYQIQALLPGVKPEDIDLSVQGNSLTLKGKVHPAVNPDQKVNWLLQEIGSGLFERSITLPREVDVNQITTNYAYGVLTISVPFNTISRPRKVRITSSQPEQMIVEAGRQ